MILSSENVDPDVMLDIMRRIKAESRKAPVRAAGSADTSTEAAKGEAELLGRGSTTDAPAEPPPPSSASADPARMLEMVHRARARLHQDHMPPVDSGRSTAAGPVDAPQEVFEILEVTQPIACDHPSPRRLHPRPCLRARPEDRLAEAPADLTHRLAGSPRLTASRLAAVAVVLLASAAGLMMTNAPASLVTADGPQLGALGNPVVIADPDPILPEDPRLPRGLGGRAYWPDAGTVQTAGLENRPTSSRP